MSRGRRSGGRVKRRPISEEQRTKAVQDYQESVGRFQQSAFRNVRLTVANATLVFAVLATMMLLTGETTPATFVPFAVVVLAGVLGVSTFVVKQQPLGRYLLITAATLSVIGVIGLIVATQVGQ